MILTDPGRLVQARSAAAILLQLKKRVTSGYIFAQFAGFEVEQIQLLGRLHVVQEGWPATGVAGSVSDSHELLATGGS